MLEPERYELFDRSRLPLRASSGAIFSSCSAAAAVRSLLRRRSRWRRSPAAPRDSAPTPDLPSSPPGCISAKTERVTIYTGKVEVGPNIRTSLTQAVAEELHAPIGSIKLVMADTDLTPYDMGTFGSRTTPTMAPQLKKVGAAARETLDRSRRREMENRPQISSRSLTAR